MKDFFETKNIKAGEAAALEAIAENFETFPISSQQKLANFTNWVRHRDIARFLYRAEIFQSILKVPGAIFECGVLFGTGVSTWFHLSEIYEPVNFTRRIYGFDTFSGFPGVAKEDIPEGKAGDEVYQKGFFDISHVRDHMFDLFPLLEETRKIPQVKRVKLVQGDASETVPATLNADSSLLVALLYLDMDLYEPTKKVLEACLPRMCKGSVIVFDELATVEWPGETQALLEQFDLNTITLERSPIVPHIGVLRL